MEIIHQEHFGIARKIVSNMTSESWKTIPHTCITYEPEATGLFEQLKEVNNQLDADKKITVNTALLRIIAEGLKACPKMNSHITFQRRLVRGRIDTFREIHISMPVILKTGEMMTLNMRNMESKSMSEMRDAIQDSIMRANRSDLNEAMFEVSMANTVQGLKKGKFLQTFCRLAGAKTGKHKIQTLSGKAKRDYYRIPADSRLTKHDIEQGTITVSNLGSLYRDWNGLCTILEIIPPQVAAIGIGASQNVPMADADGSIRSGIKLPMTIAFDHRALDMGDVVPFMKKLDEIFRDPSVIKNWV